MSVRARLDQLEDRLVPATYTVTTTANSGPGSLQDAVAWADATPDPDTVLFSVTGKFSFTPPGGSIGIHSPLTIQGPGGDQVILSGPAYPYATLILSKVTLSGVTVGGLTNSGDLALVNVHVNGGIYGITSTGTLSVENCLIENCGTLNYLGGSGANVTGGTATFRNTTFRANHTLFNGAGLLAQGGTVRLLGCTFTNNGAGQPVLLNSGLTTNGGGAVSAEGTAVVTAENCTFSGNSSKYAGGAFLLGSGATLTLLSCTVVGNSAQQFGGGIGLSSGPNPVLRNTIVAGNVLAQAGQPNVADDYAGSLGPGSAFNIIGANSAGPIGNDTSGNQVGTPSAPIEPMLGALGDFGGPTLTHDLLAGSPAIDHGGAFGLTTDQRGAPRPGDPLVDIGAFEFGVNPPPPPQPPITAPAVVASGRGGDALLYVFANGSVNAAGTVTPFPGNSAVVRGTAADFNADGFTDFAYSIGPGGGSLVRVVDGRTQADLAPASSTYEPSFTGGLFIAAADVDGDGRPEVIVSPDVGGGGRVQVFGVTGGHLQLRANFFAIDDPAFRGGARVAAGDLNGDGKADLVVAAGFGGGPRVAIFDGAGLGSGGSTPPKLVGDFFAFESGLRNGSFVTLGDVTGDARADLAFGGGPGGAPRVRIVDGAKLLAAGPFGTLDDVTVATQVANFFAGDPGLRGGVRLAMRDDNADGRVELAAASGDGEPSRVRVYSATNLIGNATPGPDLELDPFAATLSTGVFVG